MLGLLERCVTDLGGGYAFCDTDSMAIVATERAVWYRATAVPSSSVPGFGQSGQFPALTSPGLLISSAVALSPYDRSLIPSILKVEDVNFAHGVAQQLWAYTISAKRYVLFNRGPNGTLAVDDHRARPGSTS